MTGHFRDLPVPAGGHHRPSIERTVAILVVILVGLVGAIAVVAMHGRSTTSEHQLVTLGAVVLMALGALAAPVTSETAASRAMQAILWMVAAVVLVNVALAWIDLDTLAWRAPVYLPSITPIGVDFRLSYAAARQFTDGPTAWPPFTIPLAMPYLFFDPDAAYAVHVVVLIALNLAAIGLAVAVLHDRDEDRIALASSGSVAYGLLGPSIAAWLFVSEGFLFSLERGNYDAFAAFFAMLGLWSLVRRPRDVWLPTIAFSVAAAIKLYPAVLLLLVIWRFRRSSIVPLVASTAVLWLSAGPNNLASFLSHLAAVIGTPTNAVISSSAKSFSDFIAAHYQLRLPSIALLALPIALALLAAWRLWRRQDRAATILMACATVPLMFVIPTISYDYKLVLLAGPAVLLTGMLLAHIGRGRAEPWWMLLALLLVLFFVAVPPSLVWPTALSNKYPWILLLQGVIAWMAWRLPAEPGSVGSAGSGLEPTDLVHSAAGDPAAAGTGQPAAVGPSAGRRSTGASRSTAAQAP